jgi:hypothetical protein
MTFLHAFPASGEPHGQFDVGAERQRQVAGRGIAPARQVAVVGVVGHDGGAGPQARHLQAGDVRMEGRGAVDPYEADGGREVGGPGLQRVARADRDEVRAMLPRAPDEIAACADALADMPCAR